MVLLPCAPRACVSVSCELTSFCLAGGLQLTLLHSRPPGLWMRSRGRRRTRQEKGTGRVSRPCGCRFWGALLEGQMLSRRRVPFTASQLTGPSPVSHKRESLRRRQQTVPSASWAAAGTSRQGLCGRGRPACLHQDDVNNEIDSCVRRVLIRCSLHEK